MSPYRDPTLGKTHLAVEPDPFPDYEVKLRCGCVVGHDRRHEKHVHPRERTQVKGYRVYNDFFGPDVAVVEWSYDDAAVNSQEKWTRIVFVEHWKWLQFLRVCTRKNKPGLGEIAWKDEDIVALFNDSTAYRLER